MGTFWLAVFAAAVALRQVECRMQPDPPEFIELERSAVPRTARCGMATVLAQSGKGND